jgi:hypothetical protein
MPKVFYFQFHTVTVWAFTKRMVELAREATIREWNFSHSPATAMTGIKSCPLDLIQADSFHAELYL